MTLLPHLFEHHRWANLTLMDHLATLSPEDLQRKAPGGFGTIHETLFHMVTVEARFIGLLENDEAAINRQPAADAPALADLRAASEAQGGKLITIAGKVGDEERCAGTRAGQPYDFPAFIPLMQAYHHGVEHRTNVTTILATYDLPTPSIDLWAYQAAGTPA